jgi:23S rRNA (adenine-N6)-dimethyltransferase
MSRSATPRLYRRPDLSQHFFRDPELVRRLVRTLPIRTQTVLEIGAGTGVLTNALADGGFHVIAIEKDARLFRALRERMIGRTNVEYHHGDFFEFPLPRREFSVVANLPFNISAPAVRRLTSGPGPRDSFLVLQLEAAQKFAGIPHETLFSLQLKPSFESTIPRVFRRADFDPVPRVRPALLHIRRRDHALLPSSALAPYRRFVASAFGRSRDAGGALRLHFTRRQIARLARDHDFAMSARVSQLTFPQWLALFRYYEHTSMGRDPALIRECAGYSKSQNVSMSASSRSKTWSPSDV